jgi:hypothetical protein
MTLIYPSVLSLCVVYMYIMPLFYGNGLVYFIDRQVWFIFSFRLIYWFGGGHKAKQMYI